MAELYSQNYPDSNVIIVGWGEVANSWFNKIPNPWGYGYASEATISVGETIAQIMAVQGINPEKT